MADIDELCVNTIRTLSMDAVQKANSGHPGTPMALAPVGYTLWNDRLRFDPADPLWPNRDRFVLSVGHASMLLYSLLHLSGTHQIDKDGHDTGRAAVTLDDIQHFRQIDSLTPGHPEYHMTSGVECTTGPLGQGVANSVGMAIAERWMAATYNRPGFPIVDHRVFAICGDGDMMEGISGEAASVAGHLRLSNLVWIYDSNQITIEGSTALAFSEDVGTRFLAYGWTVLRLRNVNDRAALLVALDEAAAHQGRPTMIIVESRIAYGAPKKEGTAAAHGEPLGEDEIRGAKKFYGWPEDAKFLVPDGVMQHFADNMGKRGAAANAEWKALFVRYKAEHPDLAKQYETMQDNGVPEGWEKSLPVFPADAKGIASRDSSGKVLNALATAIPWLVGGAADLAPSTKTRLTDKSDGDLEAENYAGRNMHFGIREHAMGAICNGMALSKVRSFGSGFLIFSDYMRGAIRLSAIMEIPVVWVFTHDSIGVGEDGPTHQPIEQLSGLRGVPGLCTIRPCDANEVSEAWRHAMGQHDSPTCLILSRQALPTIDRDKFGKASGLARGGYVLADPTNGDRPRVILMATGSEVSLCMSVWETLTAEGIPARVVSLPSWDLFEKQDEAYRREILPDDIRARVAVEQAATLGWDRYTGLDGAIIGMHTFGASAPLKDLLTKFGFTSDGVLTAARKQLDKHAKS